MELVLLAIGGLAGLAALVCAILVAVKMLQNNQTALGVVTIIGLFVCGIGYLLALIFGWQNRNAWGLQKVMPIFTASLLISMVLGGIGYGILVSKALDEMNNAQTELNSMEFDSGLEEPEYQELEVESQDDQAEPASE